MYLVDSNVILDIITIDPVWFEWSSETIATISNRNRLAITEVIFAEVSGGFSGIEDVDAIVPPASFARETTSYEAAFAAGQAFRLYRRRGGARTAILSDFLIGAHALVRGYRLITRDARIYRGYFPRLDIVAPN